MVACSPSQRFNKACPNSPAAAIDARQESWRVYCGDVHVGMIGIRSGVPVHVDPTRPRLRPTPVAGRVARLGRVTNCELTRGSLPSRIIISVRRRCWSRSFVMRTSPSIVPHGADRDTYLVLNDFGRTGCSWRETDAESADRETLIRDLVDGQFRKPVRIVAFNTGEGWSRDVTVDIADELRRRYVEFGEVPDSVLDFLEANRR